MAAVCQDRKCNTDRHGVGVALRATMDRLKKWLYCKYGKCNADRNGVGVALRTSLDRFEGACDPRSPRLSDHVLLAVASFVGRNFNRAISLRTPVSARWPTLPPRNRGDT